MKRKIKNKKFYFFICFFSLFITIFMIITGAYIEKTYDISIGSVSSEKFIAADTVVNEYATKKLIKEARDSVSPLYTHDPKVQQKVLSELDTFFSQTENFLKKLKQQSSTNQNADAYIFQSLDPDKNKKETVSSKVYLNQKQLDILSALSQDDFYTFKAQVVKITSNIMEQGIREDSDKSSSFIKDELDSLMLNEDLTNLAYHIITSLIEPNLVVDNDATNKAKDEKEAAVEPVMVLKNQKIVDKGEIITEEIYSILDSLGYVKNNALYNNIAPISGICIFTLISLLISSFYIYTYHRDILSSRRKLLLILCLYSLTLIIARLSQSLPYMLVPLTAFPFLTALLINSSLAVVLNIYTIIICCFVFKGDLNFLLYFTAAGTIMALAANMTQNRTKLFIAGFFAAVINAIIAAGITLLSEKNWESIIVLNLFQSLGGSFLGLILSIGSLSIWETLFGIVSNASLLELINPNRELLRRLLTEAPGTYQHSLIVANLAETAANDIGANPTLARVGAYYHDIGKLKSPQYFSENIVGENLHDYMDPYDSAKVILSHIEEGVSLAEKHKLPQSVKDIIIQHHGNTLIKFFFFKAKNKYGEENVKQKDFRYSNPTPQSKEAAVIMLADTAEAAVRSMIPKGKTMEETEKFVKELIKDKLDDNQLKDSCLSIKDLDTIFNSFMRIFKGMYHERIPYPDGKNNKEASDNDKTDKK